MATPALALVLSAAQLLSAAAAAGTATADISAPPPPPPYRPAVCPADYAGQQETVLGWAHQLLNGTFQAGAGYANQVFLRDTATFIDTALDNVGEANTTVRPLLLKLIAFQRLTGDIGCEGVGFSGPLSCMDKSTVLLRSICIASLCLCLSVCVSVLSLSLGVSLGLSISVSVSLSLCAARILAGAGRGRSGDVIHHHDSQVRRCDAGAFSKFTVAVPHSSLHANRYRFFGRTRRCCERRSPAGPTQRRDRY